MRSRGRAERRVRLVARRRSRARPGRRASAARRRAAALSPIARIARRRRADPAEPGSRRRLGEAGVLGQEAEAGMHGVGAGGPGGGDDRPDVEQVDRPGRPRRGRSAAIPSRSAVRRMRARDLAAVRDEEGPDRCAAAHPRRHRGSAGPSGRLVGPPCRTNAPITRQSRQTRHASDRQPVEPAADRRDPALDGPRGRPDARAASARAELAGSLMARSSRMRQCACASGRRRSSPASLAAARAGGVALARAPPSVARPLSGVHAGRRFSVNARKPSWASALVRCRAITRAVCHFDEPWAGRGPRGRSTWRRGPPSGRPARRSPTADSTAASSAASPSTTSWTSPIRWARTASNRRPPGRAPGRGTRRSWRSRTARSRPAGSRAASR